MNASTVLAESHSRGIVIRASGGKLVIDAPRGAVDAGLRDRLAAAKAELIEILNPDPTAIHVPADHWRWRAANWPSDRWLSWRRLADELAPPGATADQIGEAQRLAYHDMTFAVD